MLLGAVMLLCLSSTGPAGAAPQPFSLSPASGPPGTLVTVHGRACAPGPVASATADFVRVSAKTLPVAFDIPVARDGSWSDRFTVPANARNSRGPVTAACYRDGARSSAYVSASFEVVGATTAGDAAIGTAPNGNAGGAANAAAVAAGAQRPPAQGPTTTTTTHRSTWIWWLLLAVVAGAATTFVAGAATTRARIDPAGRDAELTEPRRLLDLERFRDELIDQ